MAVYHSAAAPFNHETADVILRSTDNVDFRVHKAILAIASPFFSDMFKLGDRGEVDSKDADDVKDGLVVIPMLEEDSQLTDKLLRFCYPVPNPPLDTLDDLTPVLGAAVKYQVDEASKQLRKTLVLPQFLAAEPMRVFAVARRYDLQEEIRVAAQHVLHAGLPGPYVDELRYIPASALHQLWELKRRCGPLTIALATDFQWLSNNSQVDRNWVFFRCTSCSQDSTTSVVIGGQ